MSIRMMMGVTVLGGTMMAGLAACQHETKVYNEPTPSNTSNTTTSERRTTETTHDMDNGGTVETHTETTTEHH